jgi:hypothetical protein
VIRVQVRDEHRVHGDVVAVAAQLGEHPVAAVEQHGRAVLLQQVSRACPAGVLPGRRLPQDPQPHG